MATNYNINRGFAPEGFYVGGFWVYIPIALALQQGAITLVSAKSIDGQQLGLAQGVIGFEVGFPIVGQQLGLGQGQVFTGVAFFLTGQQLGLAQGVTTQEVAVSLVGQQLHLDQGGFGFEIGFPLVGLELSLTQGTPGVVIIPYDVTGAEYIWVDHEERTMLVLPAPEAMAVPAEQNVMYVQDDEDDADVHHIIRG